MNNIFNNITEKEKTKLLTYLKAHTYSAKKGKDISLIVRDKNSICIVEKGEVKILKTDALGSEILFDEVLQGDIFGSSISNISIDSTIETIEDTELIILDFDYIIKKNDFKYQYYNQFIKNLLNAYQEKIEKNNNRIEVLTNKTIRDKLLSYFNIMTKGKNTKILYLPFSYSALADYLAINRSAMSREIGNLKNEGLIEVDGRKIKLLYYV